MAVVAATSAAVTVATADAEKVTAVMAAAGDGIDGITRAAPPRARGSRRDRTLNRDDGGRKGRQAPPLVILNGLAIAG